MRSGIADEMSTKLVFLATIMEIKKPIAGFFLGKFLRYWLEIMMLVDMQSNTSPSCEDCPRCLAHQPTTAGSIRSQRYRWFQSGQAGDHRFHRQLRHDYLSTMSTPLAFQGRKNLWHHPSTSVSKSHMAQFL